MRRRRHSEFLLALLFVVFVANVISAPCQESSQPFKISLAPPEWRNGCLQLRIDRVNASHSTLYLPGDSPIVVSTWVMRWSNTSAKHGETGWVAVYGVSDIGGIPASPLARGEARNDHLCIKGTVPVADLKQETRREIPVRGKIRIDSFYFLNEQEWIAYRAEQEELLRTGSGVWPTKVVPRIVTLIATIPCAAPRCAPPCDGPPVVLDGEALLVPDVLRYSEGANKRGRAITTELSRSSGCDALSESNQTLD